MLIFRDFGFFVVIVDEEGIFVVGFGIKLMIFCKEVDVGSCFILVVFFSCEMIDDVILFVDGICWVLFCVVRDRMLFCIVRGWLGFEFDFFGFDWCVEVVVVVEFLVFVVEFLVFFFCFGMFFLINYK